MHWDISSPAPDLVSTLSAQASVSPFLASLLIARGITSSEAVGPFLTPRLGDFPDPSGIPDVRLAAQRILRAVRGRERVVIFGDYDVDGVTSVAVMVSFLADLGLSAAYLLPDRFLDGYGLNQETAEVIAQEGYDLVITVDCGSSSASEVAYLKERGVDVVVTDHHRILHEKPPADAFVNPMAWEESSPFRGLAGVGVAFVVVMACYILWKEEAGTAEELPRLTDYLDLVTMGTVADMVPLVAANRSLVYNGLNRMRQGGCRAGVTALREISQKGERSLDETTIAYYMAPRINAAGRLGSADSALELLLSEDYRSALDLARFLHARNEERKELERRIFEEASLAVEQGYAEGKLRTIVLASPDWHQGVVGIVASRMVERFYRPSVLLVIKDGVATGSARSIEGFNIASALNSCRDVLLRHGGHAMAAGLTIEEARIPELQERLDASFEERLPDVPLEQNLSVDAVVSLGQVDMDLLGDIERLAPYGVGNPQPVLAARSVVVREVRTVGNGDHLKLVLEQDGRSLEAMWFRFGECMAGKGSLVDVAFIPEIREFRGISSIQLRIRDLVVHDRD